jgi:hypothetical protein
MPFACYWVLTGGRSDNWRLLGTLQIGVQVPDHSRTGVSRRARNRS